MATLVHDDLIDGARAAPRRARRLGRARRRRGARATGDYLFARAFAELAEPGDSRRVRSSPTRASRSRAARRCSAASSTTRTRPSTRTSSAARSRRGSCSRPRACSARATSALGQFGLTLGIAFQIADDILDCAGDTLETGKVAGHRPARGHADAAAPPRRPRGRARARGARRRPARRRAAARRRHRRARALPRGGALDYADAGPREPRRRASTARSSRRSPTQSSTGDADTRGGSRRYRHFVARVRPREGRGGRAARPRGRPRAASSPTTCSRSASWPTSRAAARRHGRGLLRPEPLLEPDERLPREVQVLRLRRDAEAGARLHDLGRRARRGRRPRSAS